MRIGLFKLLGSLFFIFQANANPNLGGSVPGGFVPDFSGQAFVIPQGAFVTPLCSNPGDISCVSQWSYQALPLSVQQNLEPGHYQYFLPAFLPSQILSEDIKNSEDWKPYKFSSYSSDRAFTRRRPKKRERGEASPRSSGKKEAPKEREEPAGTEEKSDLQETSPDQMPSASQKFYVSTKDPSKIARLDVKSQTAVVGRVAFIPAESVETAVESKQDSKRAGAGDTDSESGPKGGNQSSLAGTEESAPLYKTAQSTIALPSTTKEIQPGCFALNKTQSQTTAGFCFECRQGKEASVFSKLAEDKKLVEDLNKKLQKVDKKQASKVSSVVSNKASELSICSPEVSLREIIENFEKTCPPPYKGNFKKFAKETSCSACKKGIAPEVMLAMMSIESAGKCAVVGTINQKKNEKSVGLFQVDSTQHQCLGNAKSSSKNLQCLKDPINNLKSGIKILAGHYGDVNPQQCLNYEERKKRASLKCELKTPCKSWFKTDSKERDSLRKAVSAYNGGPGWIARALYSAKNVDKTLKNTSYLIGKHKQLASFTQSLNWDLSWEVLRVYYFLERLSPGNNSDSGRQMKWVESNLAHTEAVLGREVANGQGSHGMVEIWANYIQKNRLQCSSP